MDTLQTLWGQTASEDSDPTQTYKLPDLDETEPAESLNPRAALSITWAATEDEHTEAGAGAYHIIEELGRGGMAVVYRAEQRRLRRQVAVKMAKNDAAGHRFVAEARVAGMLDHPNIVPIHDLVDTPDGIAMAMRLVDGQSWEDKLEDPGSGQDRWYLEDQIHALIAVAHAVDFAHRRGVVHCDLKPDNVMIGGFGEVVLMDWGCALAIDDEGAKVAPRASRIRAPLGTPVYMAPELALAKAAEIGAPTDVYLLGGILHRLITGRPPHRGENFYAVVAAACSGTDLALADVEDRGLAEIAQRALEPAPEDRYRTAKAFRQALEVWLRTHESEQIAHHARQVLARSETALGGLANAAESDRSGVYLDIEDALAGFAQAQRLWDGNTRAADDAHRARLLVTQAAVDAGDLSFAQAHLLRLSAGPERDQMAQKLSAARAEREAQARRYLWTRRALVAAVALVALTTSIGYAVARYEADLATANAAIALSRLEEIQRLSDHELLTDLTERAELLYPALPERIPELTAWLEEAEALVARIPGHVEQLEELRALSVDQVDGEYAFTHHTIRWEHDTMSALLLGLELLRDESLPDVKSRLIFAETVYKRSIDDHQVAWHDTIAAVMAHPAYGGLRIKPQVGLVPLGTDAITGFPEFAHLATGEVPERDGDGQLSIDEEHGVVLVLIPGGTFNMGAALGPAGANSDPRAHDHEGPVNEVSLGPFLLGKYEVTQAQWMRVIDANPSAYPPGHEAGGHTHTALHPVEQMKWDESFEMVRKAGLTLPTEAQWEYAARAGTTTVYWTGNAPESLQGATNIADHYGKTHDGPESWHWETFLDDGYLTHAPVGMYRPNAFGLHDTAGNVWEWCLDRLGDYTAPTAEGNGARETAPDAARVFRGGGFRASTVHARSADRYSLYTADFSGYDVGMRAAMVLAD